MQTVRVTLGSLAPQVSRVREASRAYQDSGDPQGHPVPL